MLFGEEYLYFFFFFFLQTNRAKVKSNEKTLFTHIIKSCTDLRQKPRPAASQKKKKKMQEIFNNTKS